MAKVSKKVTKKAKPITAADVAQNCADCPKPIIEMRRVLVENKEESNVIGAVAAILALGVILVSVAFYANGVATASLETERCVRQQMYESGMPYTQENWEAFAKNC